MLIQTGKLDKTCKNSAWFKKIEQIGVVVQVWELSPAQTLAWVARRMRSAGLQASDDAVRYLTERIEGNLLAAVQEINKLTLLFGQRSVTAEHIMAVVADNSRYTVFDLADAILLQDVQRIAHIMQVLQDDDTAPPLLVWALADLSRQLYAGCENLQQNISNQSLLMRMPKARQSAFQKALPRISKQIYWPHLFTRLATLDQHSKGVGQGVSHYPQRLWDEMLDCALLIAGRSTVL